MGKTKCCCECAVGVCTGASNEVSNMQFQIGGTHSQTVSKSIRNLKNLSIGDCLKSNCASPDENIGTAGPVLFPRDLKGPSCCGAFGFVTSNAQAASTASTPVEFHRDYYYTKVSTQTGLSANGCNGFAIELPWSNVFNYSKRYYITQIAKRVIDSVKLTFCPTVSAYDVPQWTVTADVCWRVVWRYVNTVYDDISLDVWAVLTNYSSGVCIDATKRKYCGASCNFGIGTGQPIVGGTGYTDLTHDCSQHILDGELPPSPLGAGDLGEPCVSGNIITSNGRIEKTSMVTGKQKRSITIDRFCAMPSSLVFPYSALVGLNGDYTIGWTNPGTPALCTYQLGQVLSGDYSDFTNYSAMTEQWNIALT